MNDAGMEGGRGDLLYLLPHAHQLPWPHCLCSAYGLINICGYHEYSLLLRSELKKGMK